jgi:putative ABC transport system substrate-binding protein
LKTTEAPAVKRRAFISLLGGAAAWPLAARAQEKVRRVGVLMGQPAGDPVVQARNAAFLQGMQGLGWTVGRNVQIEYRWDSGGADHTRRNAAELVALAPDVILSTGGSSMGPLLQVTRTVPIVFVQVTDPVGAGYVESLARPGGNATGFIPFEFGISGKWLELLKEIAPASSESQCFAKLRSRWAWDNWAPSNPWRRRLGWSCVRSASPMPTRSSAVSPPSPVTRMAR